MLRTSLVLSLFLSVVGIGQISTYTEITTPASTDLMYVLKSPATTPLNRKITFASVAGYVRDYDPQLKAMAALTPAGDQFMYWSSSTVAVMTAISTAARTLLDDTTILAMRQTLGVDLVYNVKSSEYGATGDGVTDDSAAIQAAIDAAYAADGGTVFIPGGIFAIEDHLDMPRGVTLRGVSNPGLGPGYGSVIYLTDDTEDGIIHLSSNESHSIEICYLGLRGPGETSGDCNGIYYEGTSSVYASHLHHLYIEDVNDDAFDLEGAFSLEIDHISTDDIGGWAYNGDAGPGSNFHDWQYVKASTGGLWIWAGTPTVANMNMENVPIGLKFGNSTTNQTCLPSLYNVNIEPFTDTGIWFNQGRPEWMYGVVMYAKASTAVNKGVYFDSSNYGAFVTHAYVNFTAQSGGTYTNTYYAENGAISSIPIIIYDSDGTVAGMNSYMIKDSVVLYGESGDPTDGGIMGIGSTLKVGHNIQVHDGSTGAGKIRIYEDSDAGENYVTISGQSLPDINETMYPIYTRTVDANSAEIKNCNAAGTPIELVPAPGANRWAEFVGASLWLDYGSEVLVEPSSPDNLTVEYDNGTGPTASAAITANGFITAMADTMAYTIPVSIAGTGATAVVNKNLVLMNGDENYTGNASNDTAVRIIVQYRIHDSLGL